MAQRRARALMVLGTGSGVGKSVIVAAILRWLRRRGVRCAPFKAQNMALNSYVTHDGLEMGRAQVYQAEAAGLRPDCRMNPILLKPNGDSTSQVIILGKPRYTISASDYYRYFKDHQAIVHRTYDELSQEFEVIVLEGAGSPAEINLQSRDLVNTKMAAHAHAPCLIVGDIDRGGVFAWLKGTLDLIEDEHRGLVKGVIINKFRGDLRLLEPGLRQFEALSKIPVVGVLPWLSGVTVDQEDGMYTRFIGRRLAREDKVRIGIIHLPRISNFTDFIPLSIEPDCEIELIEDGRDLEKDFDCVIIPGSKATISDLRFLHSSGLKVGLLDLYERGESVIMGICGGYQMLGERVLDPLGVEGAPGEMEGLGLLPIETTMSDKKHLSQTTGHFLFPGLAAPTLLMGYEIHAGRTHRLKQGMEVIPMDPANDSIGMFTRDGRIIGTYLHGLFDNDGVRRSFLDLLRSRKGLAPIKCVSSYMDFKEENLDRLADWLEGGLDMDWLSSLLRI